jgi:1-acyl-sn-glycerol-3-phosphate acyltransferase
MSMIRTILAYAFLAALLVLILPWFILWSLLRRNASAMYRFSMLALSITMKIAAIKINVEGVENIPASVCVFAANHASNLDPLVFFPAIPRRISVLIKKELMKIPILSAAMQLAHFVPVDRGDREAAAASLDLCVRYLREGLSFAIFPEGTRSPDGRLGPFKKGAALMSIQADVPIVPVAIAGTQNLMRKGSSRIHPGKVTVHFGEPISPAGLSIDRRNELLAQLERAVAKNLPQDQQPVR